MFWAVEKKKKFNNIISRARNLYRPIVELCTQNNCSAEIAIRSRSGISLTASQFNKAKKASLSEPASSNSD